MLCLVLRKFEEKYKERKIEKEKYKIRKNEGKIQIDLKLIN